jgi:hypothetical protein
MNPVLYAEIADVKRAYFSSYQFSTCTDKQLDNLVKRHYTTTELFLRKVHTLPCEIEIIVRLAVHFKCKYHEVLAHMVQEFRTSKPLARRHEPAYYPNYHASCFTQPCATH